MPEEEKPLVLGKQRQLEEKQQQLEEKQQQQIRSHYC
jgi:hypothetical protein